MSAIPILFTLLLSLISGSAKGGQETDPILQLRQTLRQWWETYKEYYDEVTLGYCWADYLHKLSIGLPDLFYEPLATARNHPDMTLFEMVRSLESLFPNVTADATSSLDVTREGKHPRARRAIISKSISNSDKRRGVAYPSKTIQEQPRETINETERAPSNGRAVANDYSERSNGVENERDAPRIDHAKRRQRTFLINGQHEFPSQWHMTWRKRNVEADDALPDTQEPGKDRGIKEDPEGRRGLSNNGGSSSSLQLRQANAGDPRTNVKLMDFEENSSRDSLLLPDGAVAGRSSLESRGSGEEAAERTTAFSLFKTVSRRKRYAQQPMESFRDDGNISTIHPVYLPQYKPSSQQIPYQNFELYPLTTTQKLNEDNATRTTSVPLSPNSRSVSDDHQDLAGQSIDSVKSIASQARENQSPVQQQSSIVFRIYAFVVFIIKTVAMYIQAIRNVINRIYRNQAFRCTKNYLWNKLIHWLETYKMNI